MKKKFALLLSLILILGIFTGCSSSTSTTSGTSSNGVVNLTVWHPEADKGWTKAYKDIIQKFNEQNKGKIHVDFQFIPRGSKYAYEDKVSAAATSNTLPDLLSMDGPNVSNYAASGIIVPIDNLVKNKSDFVDSIITQGTYNGKLYTVGPTESTVALFYNKKMLADAGITPPTKLEDAWTWDQFYEAAKKLTNKSKGIYGVNWTLDYGEWIIYFSGPTVWSNGGEFLSKDGSKADGYINGPKTVAALKYLQKFTKEGLVNLQPTPTEFENGKAAMMLMGSWEWEKLKGYPNTEWGITFYPRSNDGKQVSPSGDWNWGITKNTKHKKEAAKLLNYLTNTENVKILAEAAGKPAARKSSFAEMKEWDQMPLKVLKDQVMNTAHPRPRTTSYPVLSTKYGQAVQNIFMGGDVKKELDKVAQDVDQDIKRKQK